MLNKLLELSLLNEKSSQDNTREIAIKDIELDNAKKKINAGPTTLSNGIMNTLVELLIKQLETTISALLETKDKLDVESKCIKKALDKVSKLPPCQQQSFQQKPHPQPTTVDFFQEIIRGITADKAAADKAAADKAAIEKAVAEKVATEKLATEKLVAEKVAAEKLAAEKVAADKATQEARDRAFAEKLQRPRVPIKMILGKNPHGETTKWKVNECFDKSEHAHGKCPFWHPGECLTFSSENQVCDNQNCHLEHNQPFFPCKNGKKCTYVNCKFDH
jgi:hypothetical protein